MYTCVNLKEEYRLSQSRSHGFLVWCGRTRHELSLARSRFALGARTIALRAGSTCEQV